MLVLGIDTETTGIDIQKDSIVELGAVLFDISDNGSWEPVESFCSLVYEDGYIISPEAEKVNGISIQKLKEEGISLRRAIEEVLLLAARADYIIAHNAQFDLGMLSNQCQLKKISAVEIFNKPWLCSIEDLPSNEGKKCLKLSHLAVDYGVIVNPDELHRATGDILLMGKMLEKAKADIYEMHRYSIAQYRVLAAEVTPPWEDNGKSADIAKSLGFSWEKTRKSPKPFKKMWVKAVKALPEILEKELNQKIKIRELGDL